MKALLSLIISIILSIPSFAQSDTLKVFYLLGQAVQLFPQKITLKLNMPLYNDCEVELAENASVILINKEGFSVPLVKGINHITEKINLIKNQNSQFTIFREFLAFIWHKMTEEHKDLTKYAKRYMRDKGLSFRDGCTTPLMEMPYYGTSIQGDSVYFSWKKDSVENYTFKIYNAPTEGKELYSIDVLGQNFKLASNFLSVGIDYYWVVFPKNNPNCIRFKFKIEKSDAVLSFKLKMRELESQLNVGEAMNALVKAELYEQYSFLLEAQNQYKIALKLEPNNAMFQEMYTLFMARNFVN